MRALAAARLHTLEQAAKSNQYEAQRDKSNLAFDLQSATTSIREHSDHIGLSHQRPSSNTTLPTMHKSNVTMSSKVNVRLVVLFTIAVTLGALATSAEAGQGCPFDDGSCQEYCNQQGCNMGYCGHFAWIQCICRKCGDEWSWYDKVRYNPDKTVNQTELDSLNLNGTAPLILTNSSHQQSANVTKLSSDANKQVATLTTLLIPDLSDSNKLDLNDIPDENSDKFLDYLAKNHEKLVQATSGLAGEQQAAHAQKSDDDSDEDDAIEIQISSSSNNNNTTNQQPPKADNVATTAQQQQPASDDSARQQKDTKAPLSSPLSRLLKVEVVEPDVE